MISRISAIFNAVHTLVAGGPSPPPSRPVQGALAPLAPPPVLERLGTARHGVLKMRRAIGPMSLSFAAAAVGGAGTAQWLGPGAAPASHHGVYVLVIKEGHAATVARSAAWPLPRAAARRSGRLGLFQPAAPAQALSDCRHRACCHWHHHVGSLHRPRPPLCAAAGSSCGGARQPRRARATCGWGQSQGARAHALSA